MELDPHTHSFIRGNPHRTQARELALQRVQDSALADGHIDEKEREEIERAQLDLEAARDVFERREKWRCRFAPAAGPVQPNDEDKKSSSSAFSSSVTIQSAPTPTK